MTTKTTPMDRAFAKVLRCLNSAFKADPQAMHALMCMFSPCVGKGLYKHPHVVVGGGKVKAGTYTVGPMGLINGLLTAAGMPRVAMKWKAVPNDESQLRFVGFVKAGDVCQPKKFKKGKK